MQKQCDVGTTLDLSLQNNVRIFSRCQNTRLCLIFDLNYAGMFEGPDFPKSLDEDLFNRWLENGRQSKMGYKYLLIIWDDFDSLYRAVYTENRNEISMYEENKTSTNRERLVAAYDLYSESRLS